VTINDSVDTGWYQVSMERGFELLDADENGLWSAQAAGRLAQHGPNELRVGKPSAFMRFAPQFHNPLVYLLLAAVTGALSLAGADMLMDTVVITVVITGVITGVIMGVLMGVVVLNALLGFFQEGKTEAALEALQGKLVASCTVRRDGRVETMATRELIPGDIVLLGEGDRVPADLRLFFGKNAHAFARHPSPPSRGCSRCWGSRPDSCSPSWKRRLSGGAGERMRSLQHDVWCAGAPRERGTRPQLDPSAT
jgi:magnesium-transporting ATPase (P-type)